MSTPDRTPPRTPRHEGRPDSDRDFLIGVANTASVNLFPQATPARILGQMSRPRAVALGQAWGALIMLGAIASTVGLVYLDHPLATPFAGFVPAIVLWANLLAALIARTDPRHGDETQPARRRRLVCVHPGSTRVH